MGAKRQKIKRTEINEYSKQCNFFEERHEGSNLK